MAMVINTNTASLTTQRHLSTSRNDMEKAMERMSSGSRINSSMDDAAGLAIGNRMTSQVEGLNQAVRNANDGISLAQTAEGALQSSSNILQRMRVLAVQAANDTYSTVDRKAINNEIVQLKQELNRGVSQASFNGSKILDGTNASFTFQVGHKSGDNVVVTLGDMRGGQIGTQSWDFKAGTALAAVPATATMTISGAAIKATDTMTMTVGSATLAHTFASTADLATSTAAYVTAWNDSTDPNVAMYTASNVAGAITITENTATAGPLNVAGSVTQVGTPATATMTIEGTSIAATDTMTMTVGSATLAHTFASTADLATSTAAYVTAWNNSADANVSLYEASSSAGTITITQKAATTGALTASGSVARVAGADIAVASGGAAAAGTTGAVSDVAVLIAAAAGTTGVVAAPSAVVAVTAVTAVPATATMTLSGAAIKATDTMTMTAGSATFAHTFTTDSQTLTENTAEYVAAWNASTDDNVSLYTASNVAGTITITEDTATTGALTVAGSVAQVGTSSDVAVATAAAAGTTGVAGVAEQESYDFSSITLTQGDRVALTIGSTTYTQEFVGDEATTLSALGAKVVNGDASYVSKTVDTDGKLVFTGATIGTALASATTAVEASNVAANSSVDDIVVTDTASAKAALAVLDGALEMMSDFRARLGASSNRMFITVDNLMSMSENTAAARSRIVDADFAAESASLAKSQILQKAGTAMLSQANASTQDILSLLK
jgi:flagellin